MTIVSLLATTVLFGWRIAASAWQKASVSLDQSRGVLAASRLLQEQMASMLPYNAKTSQGALQLFFEGDPKTARFISRYSVSDRASSGLYRVEYHVEQNSDGTAKLLLNEFPINSREELGAVITGTENTDAGPVLRFVEFNPGPQTITVLDHLKECYFEYYRLATPAPEWKQQWVMNGELPKAMAIRIVPSTSGQESAAWVGATDQARSQDLRANSIVATIFDSAFPPLR